MLFPVDHEQSFAFPPLPVDIRFGCGSVAQLPALVEGLRAQKVLIVTDPGVVEAGLVDGVTELLLGAGIACQVFDQVRPDSGSSLIMAGASLAREGRFGAIVGIGGGSSLDSAKAIAAMATNEGSILDYIGLDQLPKDPLPSICIPTTSGTGSEVSIWSVLTDDTTGNKVSAGGARFMAKVALCDPDLTVTLPATVTATTGMDALGHAVECFVNRACQPISGALALQSIALIGKSLRTAVADGGNRSARYDMMLASILAGMAMNPTRLGLAHALAMPLGSGNIKIPHGTIIATTLPAVMAFNAEVVPERYAAVARALGADEDRLPAPEAARAGVRAVRQLKDDVGIPSGLAACGFEEAMVEAVVEEAMKSGNVPVNPRATQPHDLAQILRSAL